MSGLHGTQQVLAALERWHVGRVAKASAVCKTVIEPMIEKRAKANAPWTDRTGDARRLLHAETLVSASEVVVRLHHGVYYGLFLEVSHAGRFAILKPTLDDSRSDIMNALRVGLRS